MGGLGNQASRGQNELRDTRVRRVKNGRIAKFNVDRNFEKNCNSVYEKVRLWWK